jgi:hypothetical protein
MNLWSTQTWLNPDGRRLKVNGELKKEYVCIKCRRRFDELASGERFAAFASAFDFEPLAQDVTRQSLEQPCPGQRQASDHLVYGTRLHSTKELPP